MKTIACDSDQEIVVQAGYKRRFDISILVISHLLLFPFWILLWVMIPILIWSENREGPIFYRQRRSGQNGHQFEIIKFRTMVPNADKIGPAWTIDHDPRITRVGRLLRRTALDELPGLINIWKGHMSFVGPRALDVNEQRSLEDSVSGFEKRLAVRPGLTGLAQVCNRSDDPNEKFRYDMEYIEKMGWVLDSRLLLQSVYNSVVAQWDHRSGKVQANEINSDRVLSETEIDKPVRDLNPKK